MLPAPSSLRVAEKAKSKDLVEPGRFELPTSSMQTKCSKPAELWPLSMAILYEEDAHKHMKEYFFLLIDEKKLNPGCSG